MKFKGKGTQKVPATTIGRGGGNQRQGGAPDAATPRKTKGPQISNKQSRRPSPTNGGDKAPFDRNQTKQIAGELQNRLRARDRGRMMV